MKRCLPSLVIRELQIKSTIRYYFPLMRTKSQIASVGEDIEKLESSHIAGGNVK
jgi:hypothetical protein